ILPGRASPASFTLVAAPESWSEFAKHVPVVGTHTVVVMQRVAHLKIEGDMLFFGRNLLFLEQLFTGLRHAPAAVAAPAVGMAVIEPVVGRYLRLDFKGRPHRIYFEEAGQGIPLVCLHTAGADG